MNERMIKGKRTRTFRVDKKKGRLISANDWENLEGLLSIVADALKLGDRKGHCSEIRQDLESSVLVFPKCTACY